jgi:hypothetical protein
VASEFEQNDNPIERILLTGFPNPERIGCPLPEVIEAMGRQEYPRDDPAWSHIWKCSPCYAAFKVVRDERLAQVERKEKIARHVQLAFALGMGLLLAALIFLLKSPKQIPPQPIAAIQVDLTDVGTSRGAEDPSAEPILAHLPRRLVELHLTLPRLSPSGHYIIGILKSRSTTTAVA